MPLRSQIRSKVSSRELARQLRRVRHAERETPSLLMRSQPKGGTPCGQNT